MSLLPVTTQNRFEPYTKTPGDLIPEAVLVERAQRGDTFSFEALYSIFYDRIYNYARRMMGNAQAGEDMAQLTFLKAWANIGKTSTGGAERLAVEPWLYRIATNACLDELRRRNNVTWLRLEYMLQEKSERGRRPIKRGGEPVVYATYHTPEDDCLQREQETEFRTRIASIAETMPHTWVVCLTLYQYQGLSYEEIGQVIGKSSRAVKAIMWRARQQIGYVYQKRHGNPFKDGTDKKDFFRTLSPNRAPATASA